MTKLYNSSPRWQWVCMSIPLILVLLLMTPCAQAQQGSSGNTTIFGGSQMTFFGNHNFSTGGGGTQPGIINTIRTSPMGVLNFGPLANVVTGADDANYVDGYVRKLGTTPFVFPVGDNSHYGPFSASGDGTTGAYYFVDASTAITSMLPSGNYPVLPAGGPFPAITLDPALNIVSTIEYWDIDGTNPTPLTLTWSTSSAISALTGNSLPNLTIAGWDGTKWVAIPSRLDGTSVLGGTSNLTAGSITTNSVVVPNTYTAYTFAARITPLPVTLTIFDVLKEGQTAQLKWSTTFETNSDRFEIERSTDGKAWMQIGAVKSNVESSTKKDYKFTDQHPVEAENLYRLKIIDKDETFAYSRMRAIGFGPGLQTSVYPNPTSDKLMIQNFDRIKEVFIYDPSGSQALHIKQLSAQGVDISKLGQGVYTVKFKLSDGTITAQKIVVAR